MAGLLRDRGAALKRVEGKPVSYQTRRMGTNPAIAQGIKPGDEEHAMNLTAVERSVRRALRHLVTLLAAVAFAAIPIGGECGEVALKLLKQFDLPGVEGRIDHMIFDRTTQRLFVAALGNNSLEVVDLEKETTIASIREFERPQNVALLPEKHELLITNGDNRYLDIYDTQTLQRKRRVELKGDNDSIGYDSKSHMAYVGCGEGGEGALCVVDTADLYQSQGNRAQRSPGSTPAGARRQENFCQRADQRPGGGRRSRTRPSRRALAAGRQEKLPHGARRSAGASIRWHSRPRQTAHSRYENRQAGCASCQCGRRRRPVFRS